MNDYSTCLFARPSFAEGMARALDLAGALDEYNLSLTPEQADNLALASDWKAIAQDLRAALAIVKAERANADSDVEQAA